MLSVAMETKDNRRANPPSLSPSFSLTRYFAHVHPVTLSIATTPRWRKHVWLSSWLSSQLSVSRKKTSFQLSAAGALSSEGMLPSNNFNSCLCLVYILYELIQNKRDALVSKWRCLAVTTVKLQILWDAVKSTGLFFILFLNKLTVSKCTE